MPSFEDWSSNIGWVGANRDRGEEEDSGRRHTVETDRQTEMRYIGLHIATINVETLQTRGMKAEIGKRRGGRSYQ